MLPTHKLLREYALAALLLVALPLADAAAQLRVKEVVNAKNLILEDGSAVRLAAIQAPNLVDGASRPGEPLAGEAKAALARLVEGKTLRLEKSKEARDRHGRIIAQIYDEKGTWIQCELLRQGFALVYSFPDQRDHTAGLLACEKEGRAAGRGLWREPYYAMLTPGNAASRLGKFALVEGAAVQVADVRGTVYLNFGEDWRTDFTARIAARDHRRFDKAALSALKGKLIRVRGWLYEKNGPMIDLTHPEQIELLP